METAVPEKRRVTCNRRPPRPGRREPAIPRGPHFGGDRHHRGAGVPPELAHPASTLLPMNVGATSLTDRLARFREQRAVRAVPDTAVVPERRAASVSRERRAVALAEALDARVQGGPQGPVVCLETTHEIPLSTSRLAQLPYGFDPTHPLVCLDTETTGLGTGAGTVAFLVGIGRWEGPRYRVRQLFLPDYPDEPAFLAALAQELPATAWLVTYNGRSFDWPILVTRYRLHGCRAPDLAGHLDLLSVARQLWRHRLPDARLATVEGAVAGVSRRGDLPGALIPDKYFAYLRTGHGGMLRDVATHNRQDVVSLARILVELSERFGEPRARRSAHPGDLSALGRAFVRRGRLREGLECFETALSRTDRAPRVTIRRLDAERLAADRARLLVRIGRRDDAARAWHELAARGGPLAAVAWIHVAKHQEHAERNPVGALDAAHRAGAVAARARLVGRPLPLVERDLAVRMRRLRASAEARRLRGSDLHSLRHGTEEGSDWPARHSPPSLGSAGGPHPQNQGPLPVGPTLGSGFGRQPRSSTSSS